MDFTGNHKNVTTEIGTPRKREGGTVVAGETHNSRIKLDLYWKKNLGDVVNVGNQNLIGKNHYYR